MNIVQEKIDSLNSVLKVQLKPEDYTSQVDSAIRKYSKKVSMPGFRPGHVPTSLVKKMYGKSMLAEELNRIVAESVDKYLNENKINVIGNPMLKSEADLDINLDQPVDFEFAFDLGIAPEVNLSLPPSHRFTAYDIQVDDKMIAEEIERIQKRYGEYINPEQTDAESSIYGNFEELDAAGNNIEGGHSNQSFLLLDKISDPSIRQQFIGKKVQDTVVFNPSKALNSQHEIKYLLGLKDGEHKNENADYRLTIERINKVHPAEINQALFDRVYGEGNVTDEAGFREKIKSEIAEGYKYESENSLKHEMEDVLLDAAKLNLPDEFLKRWLKQSNNKITDEQLATEYNQYARDLKWKLIENKIFKDQQLNVTKEEVQQYAKTLIIDQYLRYGQAHMLTEDRLKELSERYLQNEDSLNRAYESLSSRKVFEYLNQIISKDVKTITHDEFVDIMTKHHQQHHHH